MRQASIANMIDSKTSAFCGELGSDLRKTFHLRFFIRGIVYVKLLGVHHRFVHQTSPPLEAPPGCHRPTPKVQHRSRPVRTLHAKYRLHGDEWVQPVLVECIAYVNSDASPHSAVGLMPSRQPEACLLIPSQFNHVST